MKKSHLYRLMVGAVVLVGNSAIASTSYGTLNNFDVVNDTDQECHGFEIELEDIHKTDITYTYDWNHYSAPVISEDNTDPAHPKVFVRYQSLKNPDGSWAAYTAVPSAPIAPTNGHMCTNPSVNQGCEHFGVGFYGKSSAIKYHWLVDDGNGSLVRGPAVNVATPSWIAYKAPGVVAKPGDAVAQVVAVIPAPVEPIPPAKKFGEASWVKIIKTKTHNNKNLPLKDLVGDDKNGDGEPDWTNGEPDEVETEWKLLQINSKKDKKAFLNGKPDPLPNKNETVTRRYEFYKYVAGPGSIDGETGEAMCDAVGADGIHGDISLSNVGVTNANGDTVYFNCSAVAVVGEYTGAQMAGFDPAAVLGFIDNLQDADTTQAYSRRVVVGGSSPYAIQITSGALPDGMRFAADTLDPTKSTGILEGTPTTGGDFSFNLTVTDALGNTVSTPVAYALHVTGPGQPLNHVPQATADNVRTYPRKAITINVLANDSDADGDALTLDSVSRPANGTASMKAGSVVYRPKATFSGVDHFTYGISDGQGGKATATVSVTVAPNQLPVAVTDNAVSTKNTSVTIDVLANDTDPDGDTLKVLSVTAPVHGTVKKNANNTVTFKPARNFVGVGGFTYTNNDGHGGSSVTTVAVTVQ